MAYGGTFLAFADYARPAMRLAALMGLPVTRAAHAVGASVEGELGVLGSLETGEAAEEDGSGATGTLSHDQLLTDPDQAADFVARTKCDALAIACGTSHGAYKFSRKPDGDILSMDTIARITAAAKAA